MRHFRLDVQALRALAVLLVIAFHLYPDRLTGGFIGVDVFFVISGFLITSHISREIHARTFSLRQFWARRIRRLLPAAFLVLMFSFLAVEVLGGLSEKADWFRQIVSSAVYLQNWHLATNAIDYSARQNSPSPVQHFWSLSVEEQFYAAWPILLVGMTMVVRSKDAASVRRRMLGLLSIIFVASLGYSILLTATNPKVAYFSTFTRAWEFAAGGMLALVAGQLVPDTQRFRRDVVAGVSFVALAVVAAVLTSTVSFPSATALLAVVPTCLVLWAQSTDGSLRKLWEMSLIQRLGDASYSAYLWHWPLIIFIPLVTSHVLRTSEKTLIFFSTLVLASLTRKYVELPFIGSSTRRSITRKQTYTLAAVASSMFLITGSISATHAENVVKSKLDKVDQYVHEIEAPCFGANARQDDGSLCTNPKYANSIFPDPQVAYADTSSVDYPKCRNNSQDDWQPRICAIGDRTSEFKVLLVGDSHAAQFRGPLGLLAVQNHWRLDAVSKGACAFNYSFRTNVRTLARSCKKWVSAVARLAKAQQYDLIVTSAGSGFSYVSDTDKSALEPAHGLVKIWREVLSPRTHILVIKDLPRPVSDVTTCVQRHLETANTHCSVPRNKAFRQSALPTAVHMIESPRVRLLNLDDVYCGPVTCEAVIGNVLVYRDSDYVTNSFHLTNTFAKTLQSRIGRAVAALMTH